jgi:hypothetical protein
VSLSESRRLTSKVLVRFTDDDLIRLQQEADRLDVSLPQLIREVSLSTLPPRLTSRSASMATDQPSRDEQPRRLEAAVHVA